MSIIFTNHALQRCKERNIKIDEITDCISNPDSISQNLEITCYKKLWKNKYILLVYAKDNNENIIIITALKTSRISKYLTQ